MTSTDTDTTDHDDAAHIGTPPPSALYDGCNTPAAVDARYKEIWADKTLVSEAGADFIREDHRRAHVRLVGGHGRRRSATPRPTVEVVLQPTEAEDGTLVITCAGPCGETKPARKFPTLSGGRPGREATCRDCKKAARDARKNGA